MQQTTLGCDWCGAGKNGLRPFAVTTLALTNGKHTAKAPTLDLCARHVRQMVKQFQPMKKKRGPYTMTKKELSRRAEKFEPMWQAVEKKVLGALKDEAEGLKGPALVRKAKIAKFQLYKVTQRLIAAGKVKRVAEHGRQGFVLA